MIYLLSFLLIAAICIILKQQVSTKGESHTQANINNNSDTTQSLVQTPPELCTGCHFSIL